MFEIRNKHSLVEERFALFSQRDFVFIVERILLQLNSSQKINYQNLSHSRLIE
jgi:hypothetical protein